MTFINNCNTRQFLFQISKLEERLKSLQNAHNVRCTNCPPMKLQIQKLQERLIILTNERRRHLEELFEMK